MTAAPSLRLVTVVQHVDQDRVEPPSPEWLHPDGDRQVYFLHGDEFDDVRGGGCVSYFCSICDVFAPSSHLKGHSRQQNLDAYNRSVAAFLSLATETFVARGGDDNLIERALDREVARRHIQGAL